MGINNFYPDELVDSDIIIDLNNNMILPNLHLANPSKSIYLSEDIFAKYFDVILLSNFQILPSNSLKICPFKSIYITDYFIVLDFINFSYEIPNILKLAIDTCNLSSTRFYVIPLRLNLNYKNAHSNLVIVDTELGTIEFFEPHGTKFSGTIYELPYNIEKHVKMLINLLFPIKVTLYKFRNVQNSCPKGLQSKQSSVNDKAGHCLAWSLLFIHLRILNLVYDTTYIINYLHKNSDADLDLYIKRYIGYLENSSLLLEKKFYPTIKHPMTLSLQELVNVKNRVKFLLLHYTDLSLILNKNPDDFEKISKYFEELISYHKIKNFDNIFFKYFNKYALYTEHKNLDDNLSDSSSDTSSNDEQDILQKPKHINYSKKLTLENSNNKSIFDRKRKASNDEQDILQNNKKLNYPGELILQNNDEYSNNKNILDPKRKASTPSIISNIYSESSESPKSSEISENSENYENSEDSEDEHLDELYSNYNNHSI